MGKYSYDSELGVRNLVRKIIRTFFGRENEVRHTSATHATTWTTTQRALLPGMNRRGGGDTSADDAVEDAAALSMHGSTTYSTDATTSERRRVSLERHFNTLGIFDAATNKVRAATMTRVEAGRASRHRKNDARCMNQPHTAQKREAAPQPFSAPPQLAAARERVRAPHVSTPTPPPPPPPGPKREKDDIAWIKTMMPKQAFERTASYASRVQHASASVAGRGARHTGDPNGDGFSTAVVHATSVDPHLVAARRRETQVCAAAHVVKYRIAVKQARETLVRAAGLDPAILDKVEATEVKKVNGQGFGMGFNWNRV